MEISTCPLQKDTSTLWDANNLKPMSLMEATGLCAASCYLNGTAGTVVVSSIFSLAHRTVQQWKAGNTHGAIIDGAKATLLTVAVVIMTGIAYQTCSTAISRIG